MRCVGEMQRTAHDPIADTETIGSSLGAAGAAGIPDIEGGGGGAGAAEAHMITAAMMVTSLYCIFAESYRLPCVASVRAR